MGESWLGSEHHSPSLEGKTGDRVGALVSATLVFVEMPSPAEEGWKLLGVEGVPWVLSMTYELGTQVEQKNTPGWGLTGKPLSYQPGGHYLIGGPRSRRHRRWEGSKYRGPLFELEEYPPEVKGDTDFKFFPKGCDDQSGGAVAWLSLQVAVRGPVGPAHSPGMGTRPLGGSTGPAQGCLRGAWMDSLWGTGASPWGQTQTARAQLIPEPGHRVPHVRQGLEVERKTRWPFLRCCRSYVLQPPVPSR